MDMTQPRQEACPKCGGDDLHLRYAESHHDCPFPRRYSRRRPLPCREVEGEHIEVHCRSCSYGWNEEPLEAGLETAHG